METPAAAGTATSGVAKEDDVIECKAHRVDAVDPSEPCDLRSRLQSSVQALSLRIRPTPPLPASPLDGATYLPYADLSQCGLQLPCQCCAFISCTWTGAKRDVLLTHLLTSNLDDLEISC